MTGQLQFPEPAQGAVNPAAGSLAISDELDLLIRSVNEWDKQLIEQAIEIFGADGRPFSMNDFRHLLPDMAWGMAGRVILSMVNRRPAPIVEISKVRSTSPDTHKKEIGLYVLAAYAPTRAVREGRAAA